MRRVPAIRITGCNAQPPRPAGDFVLYWMIAFRRTKWNFALDRATEWARELGKPLVILEALRCDYPWASERLHRFVLDGMAEKARGAKAWRAFYYPYVETAAREGQGLIEALGARACVVVTDDFPCFFLPRMVQAAAKKLGVRLEAVDSNGLLPLRAAPEIFSTASAFRRFLQKRLPEHLDDFPRANPLARLFLPRLSSLPRQILRRWPLASVRTLEDPSVLSALPIDHRVKAAAMRGGERAGQSALRRFLAGRLRHYSEWRNQPEKEATSGLSAYLHFGHVASHQIFHELTETEDWSQKKLALRATGSRAGWWGMSEPGEAFLDQLITWREIGFNMSSHSANYNRYTSLPEWARRTLDKHARDERSEVYALDDFDQARSNDPLWNAAQRQLSSEGRMHNYLRMLWGKKILQWSRKPEEALKIMIELNNRYALDGRDPNSYSGIFWCLGRYDRPWGPERPIFGTVRYMSSENTARKVRVKDYLRRYAA
jgi:deoxyribodipyrimidine photo-lyase